MFVDLKKGAQLKHRSIKLIAITSLIFSALILLGCEDKQTNSTSKTTQTQLHELRGNTMGTYYNVKYVGEFSFTPEALQKEIDVLLEAINDDISTYRPDSALSKFNQSTDLTPQKISAGFADSILISQRVGRATFGAMNITVGPLVNLWGFGPEKMPDNIPNEQQIEEARKKVGLEHLVLTSNNQGEWLQKNIPDLYVDLSTVGEGLGADEVARFLRSKGISNYLVSIGGTITGAGVNQEGKLWAVAIEKPTDQEQAIQQIIQLNGQSISTSGSYRNYYEKDGVRYSHVIDPTTGKPITHNLVSVTVISPTALEADAWDTGLMVLGKEKALEVANQHGLAIYVITKTENGFEASMTDSFKPFLSE